MEKKLFVILFLFLAFFELKAENNSLKTDTDSTIYNRVWVLSRLNNRKINYKQGKELPL